MEMLITHDLSRGFLASHAGFQSLGKERIAEMEIVAQVFPFSVNKYVVEQLIDWSNPDDPIFKTIFPQRGMLKDADFLRVEAAFRSGNRGELAREVFAIRSALNPHPSGQQTSNVPLGVDGQPLSGIQHKYASTVLFFPRQGQTCHTYCNFCFRWPQFIGDPKLKIEASETRPLISYLKDHPEVSDVLFTGGDPFIMRSQVLRHYVDALLEADLPSLKVIRFGTKMFTYWPFRVLSDRDATELLECFTAIQKAGKHPTIIAHFNHPRELSAAPTQEALRRVQDLGVEVRTQSPLLRGINDRSEVLADLWQEQVRLGCIPYYLYAARDTGAQHYFGVPLAESYEIFRNAIQSISGLARTVRGPVMSTDIGKIQVLGISEMAGTKVFVLQFVQAQAREDVGRIFYAKYDPTALWISDLVPVP